MEGTAEQPLALDLMAPAQARAFVADTLRTWQATCRLDDALLLTSELVANAVEYGSHPASLRIALDNDVVKIEVSDANPTPPTLGRLNLPCNEKGRGVALVDKIAESWGITPFGSPGKAVWFTLALSPDRPRP